MKVGTDAVLLGAWVSLENTLSVLDVGTGSGIIALMLAQRSHTKTLIEAIELGEQDAQQATENVNASPWPQRVKVYHKDLNHFSPTHRYDLIVSNPPYFAKSLLPSSERRSKARHNSTLTMESLLQFSDRHLNGKGRLALILPFNEGNQFLKWAEGNGFYPYRILRVFSKAAKPQERWVFEVSRIPSEPMLETLVLHDEAGQRSAAYQELTKDFYL